MDQRQSQAEARGRSPSAASTGGGQSLQQSQIKSEPSPAHFPNPTDGTDPSIGLGIGLDPSEQQFGAQPAFSTYDPSNNFLNPQQPPTFSQGGVADPASAFDLNQDFTQQLKGEDSSFGPQAQGVYPQNLLTPNFGDADFTIFPPTTGEQFSSALFVGDNQSYGTPDNNNNNNNMMASSQPHSPTPPHLLQPDPLQPSSANHSPSFNQHNFSSSPGGHSRTVSLGPEAALLPGQIDWSQTGPQFQGHRRSPSEYSDVSSVAPSPHLASSDTFEPVDHSHSPMQQPQDGALYSELHGISSFSISDHGAHSPNQHAGRSPSHSPAISPRILPQQLPDMNQQNPYLLQPQDTGFGPPASYGMQAGEAFPTLTQGIACPDMQGTMQAPPAINIDFAPPAIRSGFDPNNKSLDADSLTPPERGRPRSRPRAVTDPFNSGGSLLGHRTPSSTGSLSPNVGSDARSDSSRSLSPLERSGPGSIATSPGRRRQSTSSVPNNVIALRLADPEYNGPGSQGDSAAGAKRVQKHPATFQCTLCPKRFTRAYNLRSHFRTHTDERPFVCTVCGKAFARQHDRKRHEGLHSGEKKFVCKGDLKSGGHWGCGRRFARADALGRHFRSEAGRICIKPLLDEEANERHRAYNNEQRMQQAAAQGMVMQAPGMMMPGMDPNAGAYPGDAGGGYAFPQALLAQYPALATMNWTTDMSGGGSGMEDEMSGRSSFDASDYDEGDDGGYVSGPGTGYGQGGLTEGFGEIGYASDYGGR